MHIETILFRTSAMLPGDVTMLLEAERESFFLRVPFLKGSRTRKLSSTNGYRVFVVDDAKGGRPSRISSGPSHSGPCSYRDPGRVICCRIQNTHE